MKRVLFTTSLMVSVLILFSQQLPTLTKTIENNKNEKEVKTEKSTTHGYHSANTDAVIHMNQVEGSAELSDPAEKSNKAIVGSIVSPSQYLAGQVNTLQFYLDINSPDWEFGQSFYILFPSGFTVLSADAFMNNISTQNIVPVVSPDSVYWGNNFYISSSGGGPPASYYFTVTVSVNPFVVGNQTIEYFIQGDGYGAPPHTISGTMIIPQLVPDLWVKGITTVRTGANLSNSEQIGVMIQNQSDYVFSNPFNVSYSINGGSLVTEQCTEEFWPYDSYEFIFNQTANFSAQGTYNIQVYISNIEDQNKVNDTVRLAVANCHKGGDLLYSNGPLVTDPNGGVGGADLSFVESPLTSFGFAHNISAGWRIADDFTITHPLGWDIYGFSFFAYQTGASHLSPSTITAYNVRIWDGEPGNGGNIIWGDAVTNVLTCTNWSNIFRANNVTATTRPIMRSEVDFAPIHLPAGTYWIDWQTDGTVASGPWAPPITIQGVDITGNAKQYDGSSWAAVNSSSFAQGIPFEIFGVAVSSVNDSCHNAIAIQCGQTLSGSTIGATLDQGAINCGTSYSTPGVWYSLTGNGQYVKADLCSFNNYDTKLFVYTGTCGNFTCVTGNDDDCGLGSRVGFITDVGVEYFILVSGWGGNTGDFDLTVTCIDTCVFQPNVTIVPSFDAVEIQLSSIGTISVFDLEIIETGGAFTGIPTHTGLSNPIQISGLNPETHYMFRIMGYCVAIASDWSKGNYFNTICHTENEYFSKVDDGLPSMHNTLVPVQAVVADDFIVPAGQCFTLKGIVTSFANSIVPDSMNVAIFDDAGGYPGSPVYVEFNVSSDVNTLYNDWGASIDAVVSNFDSQVQLCAGASDKRYWVSVWSSTQDNSYWIIKHGIPTNLSPVVMDVIGSVYGVSSWTYVSSLGGELNLSFELLLVDTVAPQITCPSDTTVFVASTTGGNVNYQLPQYSDDCFVELTQVAGIASGQFFPLGLTTNTFKAEDAHGNFAVCSFNINVVDNTSVETIDNNVFDVYPNPTDGLLFVSFNQESAYLLHIFNTEGKLVYSRNATKPVSSDVIDVQFLAKGTYFLSILIGENSYSKQIIVQ